MKRLITCLMLLSIQQFIFCQNVGIGTTNPSRGKLVVQGVVGAVSAIFSDTLTTGIAIENNYPGLGINTYYNNGRRAIGNGFGGLIGMNPTNGDFHIFSSDTAGITGNPLTTNLRLLINKSGNMGLQGVANPTVPLSFANVIGNKISFWGSDVQANYGIGIQSNLLQLYTSGIGSDIGFGYGSSSNFKQNMIIKGNGNVGIGAVNPAKGKLVVEGTVGSVSAIFGDTSTGVAIENNYPGMGINTYYNGGRRAIGNGYGGLIGIDPTNGDFHIYSSDTAGVAGNFISSNLRLLINKDGNIGVQGVANPVMPLTFANTAGNKIDLWGSDPAAHYGMGIQANLLQFYTSWNGADIAFGYGGSNNFSQNMIIKGNGNVGIGTSNPSYPVTLNKEGNGFVQKGTTVEMGTATNATAGIIKTYTNHSLQFYTGNNPTTQLSLNYNGRVGIGTAAPSVKLEIKHNDFDLLQLTNTNTLAAGENIEMNFRTGNYYTGGISTIGTSATTARLGFSTGSLLTERLSITHNGKVGINNSNPANTLEVNGTTEISPDAGTQTALIVNGGVKIASAFFAIASGVGTSVTIDNVYCNNKPDAVLLVTPERFSDVQPISIWYDNIAGRWKIHHEFTALAGERFHVFVANY